MKRREPNSRTLALPPTVLTLPPTVPMVPMVPTVLTVSTAPHIKHKIPSPFPATARSTTPRRQGYPTRLNRNRRRISRNPRNHGRSHTSVPTRHPLTSESAQNRQSALSRPWCKSPHPHLYGLAMSKDLSLLPDRARTTGFILPTACSVRALV